ncbi:DNA ligase [Paenibacillus sp. NPDC058174]|uniref:ATP-dependent DNA ligase n=1 Tax=Paenibacillus sp. NPDC058174 TaxID=3346366 RepID=UPI0036DA052F
MVIAANAISISEPMIPVSTDRLPQGSGWVYQLKWDGVRMVAWLDGKGEVQLYSRKLLHKEAVYPEIVRSLSALAKELGPCVLDGEVVYWDGVRPNFQKVLQRERIGGMVSNETSSNKGRVLYVVFDLLQDGQEDLRPLPFLERHKRLLAKLDPVRSERILTTELFTDAEALWKWVVENRWEGVVSKRADSPYREGKKHQDWLKKKTALLLDVGIVGVKRREGRAASLVMADPGSGCFLGSVSLGLDDEMRRTIGDMLQLSSKHPPSWPMPFHSLPAELKGEEIIWLPAPMPCRVTGLEMTSGGLLRHPKLVSFGRPGAVL